MYDALIGTMDMFHSGAPTLAAMPTFSEEGHLHSLRDKMCMCNTDNPTRGNSSPRQVLKTLQQCGNHSLSDSRYLSRADTWSFDSCDKTRGGTSVPFSPRGKVRKQDCVRRPNAKNMKASVTDVCDRKEMNDVQDLDGLCEHLKSVEMTDTDGRSESESKNMLSDSDCPCDVSPNKDFRVSPEIAELFRSDSDGDTLLHSAIITGNEQLARAIINMAPSWRMLNIQNRLKQTPLHLAVLTQQRAIVRRLMAGGADITARDARGNTPLHVACREGHVEIARALMEPVRYPETKQNSYDLPYQRLPQNLQIANYEGLAAIHLAVLRGSTDIVNLLVEQQADINCGDIKSGRSVLHMACEMGNLEVVTLLLKYKSCGINARTYNGLTPFDLARDRGHARITYELAVAGASYDEESDMDEY